MPPLCHVLQSRESLEQALNRSLAIVPNYRYAYSSEKYGRIQLYGDEFEQLQRVLPHGFDVATGVACSLSTLFQLNITGSEAFIPDLYTKIMPRLDQPDAFVMALYMRTHLAERAKRGEKQRQVMEGPSYHDHATNIIQCALKLEQQLNVSRSVWMVVTDSPDLKQHISESNVSSNRDIVTTQSRGTHSRPSRTPSIVDIAEALIDWYLIGESDVVISDKASPTFGGTAALRTARPLYDADDCSQLTLIHNKTDKPEENVRRHPQRQY